jgi:hypothetical protein
MILTDKLQTAIDLGLPVDLAGITDDISWSARVDVLCFDGDKPWVWVAEDHEYPIDLNEITNAELVQAQTGALS